MPKVLRFYANGEVTKVYQPTDYFKKADQRYMMSALLPFILNDFAKDNPAFACHLRLRYKKKKPNEKTYRINTKIRRKIGSSVSKMACEKSAGENIVFLTLTFPMDITEAAANVCWSKFTDNMILNYKMSGYVCVKELTEIRRPHYHCIIRMPYQRIQKVNNAWCATWREFHAPTPNAVRTDKKNGMIVRSIRRAVGYVSKYVSKAMEDNTVYSERCYFIDRGSLDPGTIVSEKFLNFLYDLHNTQKYHKRLHWKHELYPVEIFTFCEFYHTFDELNQIFNDNFYENTG